MFLFCLKNSLPSTSVTFKSPSLFKHRDQTYLSETFFFSLFFFLSQRQIESGEAAAKIWAIEAWRMGLRSPGPHTFRESLPKRHKVDTSRRREAVRSERRLGRAAGRRQGARRDGENSPRSPYELSLPISVLA